MTKVVEKSYLQQPLNRLSVWGKKWQGKGRESSLLEQRPVHRLICKHITYNNVAPCKSALILLNETHTYVSKCDIYKPGCLKINV